MKLIFCLQINVKCLPKSILLFQVCVTRHAQITQNSKIKILHNIFTISKKKVRDKVHFLHVDKHQSSLQVDFNTLDIKFSYMVILSLLLGIINYSQYTQNNKFPTFLQYLTKEVRNGVYYLHAHKHQSIYKLGLLFFMKVARFVQSTKNRKLVIFFQSNLRVLQLLLCSIVIQSIQIFYGRPVMFIITCFFAQPDCRNFLPGHCSTIVKQKLCEGRTAIFGAFCPKLMFLKRSRVCYSKSNYAHQTSQKKLVLGLVIQIIPPKIFPNYHTATENLHRLRGAKISWRPTLEGVSDQFGFIRFSVCLQCKISESSVFFYFLSP